MNRDDSESECCGKAQSGANRYMEAWRHMHSESLPVLEIAWDIGPVVAGYADIVAARGAEAHRMQTRTRPLESIHKHYSYRHRTREPNAMSDYSSRSIDSSADAAADDASNEQDVLGNNC